MSNWCLNKLKIEGSSKELKKLLKKAMKNEKYPFSLDVLYPCENKENENSWYVQNWGINQDLLDVEIDDNEIESGKVKIYFLTAWVPPINGFTKISKDFPKLIWHLYYDEPGMDFSGKSIFHNGLLKNIEKSYQQQKGVDYCLMIENLKYIENDEEIWLPIKISYKENPDDFEKEMRIEKEIFAILPKDIKVQKSFFNWKGIDAKDQKRLEEKMIFRKIIDEINNQYESMQKCVIFLEMQQNIKETNNKKNKRKKI